MMDWIEQHFDGEPTCFAWDGAHRGIWMFNGRLEEVKDRWLRASGRLFGRGPFTFYTAQFFAEDFRGDAVCFARECDVDGDFTSDINVHLRKPSVVEREPRCEPALLAEAIRLASALEDRQPSELRVVFCTDVGQPHPNEAAHMLHDDFVVATGIAGASDDAQIREIIAKLRCFMCEGMEHHRTDAAVQRREAAEHRREAAMRLAYAEDHERRAALLETALLLPLHDAGAERR